MICRLVVQQNPLLHLLTQSGMGRRKLFCLGHQASPSSLDHRHSWSLFNLSCGCGLNKASSSSGIATCASRLSASAALAALLGCFARLIRLRLNAGIIIFVIISVIVRSSFLLLLSTGALPLEMSFLVALVAFNIGMNLPILACHQSRISLCESSSAWLISLRIPLLLLWHCTFQNMMVNHVMCLVNAGWVIVNSFVTIIVAFPSDFSCLGRHAPIHENHCFHSSPSFLLHLSLPCEGTAA